MEGILGRRFLVLVILIVAVVAIATTQTEAQDLSCVSKLAACSDYYNNTSVTPSKECCVPLESAFKSELPCICAIFSDPAIQKQLGINIQTGIGLVNRCKITGIAPDVCTPAPSASPPTPGKTPPSPSGAPFGAKWIGFSTFFSLLFFIMA